MTTNSAILKALSFILLLSLLASCSVGKKSDAQPVVPEPGHYVGDPEVSFDVTADGQIQHFSIHMYFDNGNCGLEFKEDMLTEVNDDGSFAIMGEVPKSDKEPLPQSTIVGRFIDSTTIEGRFGPMDCGMGLFSSVEEGTWTASLVNEEKLITPSEQSNLSATELPTIIEVPDITEQLFIRQYTTSGGVHAIAYSPDGKTIAAGLYDGRIDLLDVETTEVTMTIESQGGGITALSYSPDANYLAIGMGEPSTMQDTRVLVLNTINWGIQRELEAYGAYSVLFSPDGNFLAAASWNGNAYVWDTLTWNLLYTLPGVSPIGKTLAFSPDGQLLAFGADDGTILIWKMVDGSLQNLFTIEDVNQFTDFGSLVFLDNGETIMGVQRTSGFKLCSWDVQSGAINQTLDLGIPWDFAVSPDQKLLITVSPNEHIKLINMESGEVLATAVQDDVRQVAISPSGETFATFPASNLVYLWSTELP